ncbi:MAG: hypothetical protein ACM359_09635 [Bacillota bacterium]
MGEMSLLCERKPVADDSLKVLIRNKAGLPTAVLLCSSPVQPELVGIGIERASQARCLLGTDWGRVILEPLLAGRIDGCSYGVFPYCQPLSKRWLGWIVQRSRLWPGLRNWLRGVIRMTASEPTEEQRNRDFLLPLEQLAGDSRMNDRIRSEAKVAIRRLAIGQWKPQYVLAHNDLWRDNILLMPGHNRLAWYSVGDFAIIDWPGADLKGHAFYDLIRLARSFGLPKWLLRRELDVHCRLLNCHTEDARGYLLAGLGYLGMHLECFPADRYVQCVSSCCEVLFSVDGRSK